jgi:hypothetical protein
MSLDVVSKKIEVLKSLPVVKEEHIAEVIVAAERSVKGRQDGVSNAEARAVVDFYLQAKTTAPSAKLKAPELDPGAVNKLNAFFIAHNLPYGDNKKPMKERILRALDAVVLGAPLSRAPRTGNLQPLRLDDNRLAYVDIVKRQFVLRVGADYFGPFPLDLQQAAHAA